MEYIPNILYLEASDLYNYGVPQFTVWTSLQRNREGISNSWSHIIDPKNKSLRLINYDTIPDATIKKYGIPTKQELIARLGLESIKREVQTDIKTLNWYNTNPKALDLAHEYARIACWLTYCAKMRPSEARAKGFAGTDDFYETAINLINKEAVEYGFRTWKVKNLQVFKRLLKPFNEALKGKESRDHALESVISDKFGKQNAKKTNEDFEKTLLILYVNKYTGIKLLYEQVYNEYEAIRTGIKRMVDPETGEVLTEGEINISLLPQVHPRTVTNFFNEPEIKIITSKFRDGSKYHNDRYRPYISRLKPRFSYSMTSSDGQTMPFRLIINNKLTYKRAVAYLIFDVNSEAIVGVAYDKEENKSVMQEAFNNLLLQTNGLIPMENQLDNFGRSFESDLKQLYKYVSFCQPYNPQSKYAERLIGEFEKECLREVRGYQGTNNQSKKQSGKKNPDVIEVGYTFSQMVSLYEEKIAKWNNTAPKWSKGRTRLEMLNGNVNPECVQLSPRELAKIAGEYRLESIDRGFVNMEYEGVKYQFEVPAYEQIVSHLENGWRIRAYFLPSHTINSIFIYNFKEINNTALDSFLCECINVDQVRPQAAKAEQTELDGHKLGHQQKRVSAFDAFVQKMGEEIRPVVTMTIEEAESIISAGYTEKDLMQEAESRIAMTNSELKPERIAEKRVNKEQKQLSKELKQARFEVNKTDIIQEKELVEIPEEPARKYSRW